MASLKELKIQFLEYIEIERGRSLNTVENYDRYLTRFLNFLKNDNPLNITDTSVREFRLWLNRQSNLQWKSLVGKSNLTHSQLRQSIPIDLATEVAIYLYPKN